MVSWFVLVVGGTLLMSPGGFRDYAWPVIAECLVLSALVLWDRTRQGRHQGH